MASEEELGVCQDRRFETTERKLLEHDVKIEEINRRLSRIKNGG